MADTTKWDKALRELAGAMAEKLSDRDLTNPAIVGRTRLTRITIEAVLRAALVPTLEAAKDVVDAYPICRSDERERRLGELRKLLNTTWKEETK